MALRNWLCLLLLLIVAFVVTDCSSGKTRYCAGIVRQHVYRPAYTSTDCETRNGQRTCSERYHPAEYRLLVYVEEPEHAASVETSLLNYSRYTDGARVTVGERCGRWTGIAWLDWIADKPTGSSY